MKHFRALTPLLLLCFSSVLFAQITPLPTSGPISLGEIGAYFENTAPHSLSEFYRGGSEVQNTSHNNGIPTSGAISLSDFYTTYSIPNCTLSITNESNPSLSAQAVFSFERWGEMGSINANVFGNNLVADTCGCTAAHTPRPDSCSTATCSCQGSPGWITPIPTVSSTLAPQIGPIYIKATLQSGEAPNQSSGLDTCLELNTRRFWGHALSSGQLGPTTVLVSLYSDSGCTQLLDSGTLTFSADASF